MDVEILEETENTIRFILSGVSSAFANALRRIMIAEVPTMAIEDVIIVENTSIMYDEILSHRLGLVPLTTDLDSYVLPKDCSCGSDLGCGRCRASFTLEVEAKDSKIPLLTGDLKPMDTAVAPVSDRIPLVSLAPGQKVKLEAYARLGRGAEHAKWQPVSVCAYKYLPRLSANVEKCDGCGECVKFCPKGILALENGRLAIRNPTKCLLCLDCVQRCHVKPSPLRIGWDDTSFIFYVESTGSLPARRVVLEAAKILGEKASTFAKDVKGIGD